MSHTATIDKVEQLGKYYVERLYSGKLNKKDKKIQMTLETILECIEESAAPLCGD